MTENKGDSGNNNSIGFDLTTELSTLVEKNILPKRIAERLEIKLKEKNVRIDKDQLEILVEKIRDIMSKYTKTIRLPERTDAAKTTQPVEKIKDENMQNLIETIEKLRERITDIEKGIVSTERVVTTEDMKVPKSISGVDKEWKLDPLIEIPNDPESVIILMKWLQYLIDKCGHPNLSNILDYYVDIGWLSQDAKISLIEYSYGITEYKREGENVRRDVNDLPSKDHIQSLIFIQKLKGIQIDKHFIDRIDNEISRILRKLDNYQLK
jgi:flagellar protein FlaD